MKDLSKIIKLSKKNKNKIRVGYNHRFHPAIIKSKEIIDKTAYLAIYDEVFIGFGKNVNENIFDQNRVGILLGYRFNPSIRIEAG